MKSAGIREAKARLSELARAAAKGEATVLTDYGKPIAMISSIEQAAKAESGSDAGEFRKALLSPIIWICVSRATEVPDRRECVEHLAYRYPLFATPAPLSQKSALRHWLDMHREPVFLSAASLVEIEAAIGRVPASQQPHICALQDWLDGLISTFSDRIRLVDAAVAVRAGKLLPHCHTGLPRYRFHDVVLDATAQMHSRGLLTKREWCLAHGLTSLWLLLGWPKPKTALRPSVHIRGQAKIV
jgi:antitoxin (DNA-binding transcriptional repressor) of toxin-antitoxin stability system